MLPDKVEKSFKSIMILYDFEKMFKKSVPDAILNLSLLILRKYK